jgi:lipid II:glycine glycyltransferase (peptidoglycan interpeptide bridge formation enzyme)
LEIQRIESAHPLNAFEWGMIRSVDGWTPIYLSAERDGKFCGAMMILKKRLPYIPFTILYAHKMPVWDYADDDTPSLHLGGIKRRQLATRRSIGEGEL